MVIDKEKAEYYLIGTMYQYPDTVGEILSHVREQDIDGAILRNLFHAIVSVQLDGKEMDTVTVLERIQVGEVDRQHYLQALGSCCTLSLHKMNAKDYAEAVADQARRRRCREKSYEVYDLLEAGATTEDIQQAISDMADIFGEHRRETTYTIQEAIKRFVEDLEKPKDYITTGTEKIDRYAKISGGDFIVIGGAPSSGKTALTLQFAAHIAKTKTVVYFSLETSATKLMSRITSHMAQVPLWKYQTNGLNKDEEAMSKTAGAIGRMTKLKLYIVEASGWTVPQIRMEAQKRGADVVFIDYLSLITGKGSTRYEQVTNISNALHVMAQQTGIAVFTLSQLNREGQKGNTEPDMNSLKESGAIEQDADLILLLNRVKDDEHRRDLFIAKNKDGESGVRIELSFKGGLMTFEEYIRV